jgi:hypothetical protein
MLHPRVTIDFGGSSVEDMTPSLWDRVFAMNAREAGGTDRAAIDRLPSLDLDHLVLYGAGRGLRFLEAQTDQIVGVPFDRRDVGASARSGGVLNDRLNPLLHRDSLRPKRFRAIAEGGRLSGVEWVVRREPGRESHTLQLGNTRRRGPRRAVPLSGVELRLDHCPFAWQKEA